MAEPDEGREERPEDLFEDLDKFFAPIKEDWPEGEEAEEAEEGEAPAVLEDWAGPQIDLPAEEELLAAHVDEEHAGEHEARGEPEPVGAHEPPGEHEAPVEGSKEWLPESTGEMSVDEWEAFREALDEEGFRFEGGAEQPEAADEPAAAAAEPSVPDEIGEALVEEAPNREAVEAAAEHFAEGLRHGPEDVERELLADLEEPGEGTRTIRVEPVGVDDEPAPTWKEPAAGHLTEEVEPGEAPAPTTEGPRNLQAAFISGGLLAIAALSLLVVGKAWFAGLAALVVLVGQGELYAVLRARGSQPATAVGLLIGLMMMIGAYTRGEDAVLFFEFLAIVLSFLWYMAATPKGRRGTVVNVAATMLGVTYVPFLASYVLIILRQPGNIGKNLLLVVLGITVLYDVCAYAVGSLWGSRPLAPTISPKKSWEGAVGATFVLLLIALSIIPSIDPFSPASAVGLALVIAVAAPLGDLIESTLKRDLGVKDMGSILPGHGGVLDRIDAILLAAPAAWYFFRLALL